MKTLSFRCSDKLDEAIRKLAKELDTPIGIAIEECIKHGALSWAAKRRIELAEERKRKQDDEEKITSINNA